MIILKNQNNVKLFVLFIVILFLIPKAVSAQEEAPVLKNSHDIGGWLNYPDSAKKNKIEGRVTIKLLVGLQGEVAETGEMTGPEVFYEEVKRVCVMLKFYPAKLNGKKVKCWVTVPFNFKLENDKDEDEDK